MTDKHFVVRWEIDIEDTDNPVAAAKAALEIMQDKGSCALVFDVMEESGLGRTWYVDLENRDCNLK